MSSSSEPMMLEVVDVVHKYGSVTALDNVSLSAARGEFLTILGASGSGKTTMLRVISGLEQPTGVKVLRIGGEDVVGKPPPQRSCTTVFQNYALFPHMSVAENVAYGLKIRGVAREDARRSALAALAMVQLEAKADRRIAQLSGGEKQRVALTRSIVTRPAVLLLDEPLGALDEKLRLEMQSELVSIQRSLGITFIYITHSQEEALTMSDRVVLMRNGRIEQSGRPVELFDRPASRFAAEFMGYENILPGTATEVVDGRIVVELPGGHLVRGVAGGHLPVRGDPVHVAIRAERLSLAEEAKTDAGSLNVLACTPAQSVYRGKYVDQAAETPVGRVRLRNWDREAAPTSANVVAWRADDCVVLTA